MKYYPLLCRLVFGILLSSCVSMCALITEKLRDDLERHKGYVVDVAVIGGGPAGMAAAFGIAHRQRSVVIFSGDNPGGQAVGSHLIDNLPGTIPVSGIQFHEQLQKRLCDVGVLSIDFDPIINIELCQADTTPYFLLKTESSQCWLSFGIIIATGGEDKRLHIPGEAEYWDKGIFTCVSCASLRVQRSKQVYVVGGGDASIDVLTDLLNLVPECTLLVRAPSLRAAPHMQQRILNDPRITIEYQQRIQRVMGDGEQLQEIVVVDHCGVEKTVPADCVFLAIGKIPATRWLLPLRASGFHVELDDAGYIKVDHVGRTSVPQVYAVGDVVFPEHGDHQIDLGMALARVRTARSLMADLLNGGIFSPDVQEVLRPYYIPH